MVPRSSRRGATARRKTTKTVAYSEKGGSGKSALTSGLLAAARKRKLRTFGVDLDPRASLTEELGIVDPELDLNDLLYADPKKPPSDSIGIARSVLIPAGQGWEGVDIIPSGRALANRESDNIVIGLEFRLRLALQGVEDEYDFGAFDVPARSGGKLVVTALTAATHVVLPAILDRDGYIGIQQAMHSIQHVKATLNPDLEVVAIVPSIVPSPRTNLNKAIAQSIADEFGDLYRDDLSIPRHVVRQEARFARLPITDITGSKEADAISDVYGKILDLALKRSRTT